MISETYGVFVAPAASGGSDSTGTGTRTAPYGTIGNAITKAAGKRVYVCDATYTESLTVNAAVDGTQIYGGLVCPGDAGTAWTYATGTVASVSPTVQGYALDVESLAKGAHFEDVAFTALDGIATTPGASSIAVMVNASLAVSFTRVKATAGKGVAGTSATPVTPGGAGDNWCPAATQAGSAATGGGGGNNGTCACAVVMRIARRGDRVGVETARGQWHSVPPVAGGSAPDTGAGAPVVWKRPASARMATRRESGAASAARNWRGPRHAERDRMVGSRRREAVAPETPARAGGWRGR